MKIIYSCDIDSTHPKDFSRSYLDTFFPDQTCVLFTDSNINQIPDIHDHIVGAEKIDFVLIDITHNVVGMQQNMFNTCCQGNVIKNIEQLVDQCVKYAPTIVLHCDFNYQPKTNNYFYFPVWLWMWSSRLVLWYQQEILHKYNNDTTTLFDTSEIKTNGMCCLNRTPSWHRILLYNSIVEKPWFPKISYTFGTHGHGKKYEDSYYLLTQEEIAEFKSKQYRLPFTIINSDKEDTTDVGITHPVWSTHTFNLVTESNVNYTLLSEKTAKPFVSKMIPIILGPQNTAQHLQTAGLDMFEDIVPWRTWDQLPDPRQRIVKIVEFLDSFLEQDLVAIYQANRHRVDRNKEFFHSEQFRSNVLGDMFKLSSSLKID